MPIETLSHDLRVVLLIDEYLRTGKDLYHLRDLIHKFAEELMEQEGRGYDPHDKHC